MRKISTSLVALLFPVITVTLFEFDRALSLQDVGDWKGSLALLEKKLIDHSENLLYLYHAGLAHYKLGNFEFAQNYFEKFLNGTDLQDIPSRVKGFFNQGNALYKSNKFEAAIAAYNSALALDPDNNYALTNKKRAEEELAKQKRNEEQKQSQNSDQRDNKDQTGKNDQSDRKNQQSQNKDQSESQNANQSNGQDQQPSESSQKTKDDSESFDSGKQDDDHNDQKKPHESQEHDAADTQKETDQSSPKQPEKPEQTDSDKPNKLSDANDDSTKNGSISEKEHESADNESKYNLPEPQKRQARGSINEEKNQERIKKLEELEHEGTQLVGEQKLVDLLKSQEAQDQKDNRALMRALAKSKNALTREGTGW